jgi:hypothetical protein
MLFRFHQWVWGAIDWAVGLVGVGVVLTCSLCGNEVEIHNYVNHMSYHDRAGEMPKSGWKDDLWLILIAALIVATVRAVWRAL